MVHRGESRLAGPEKRLCEPLPPSPVLLITPTATGSADENQFRYSSVRRTSDRNRTQRPLSGIVIHLHAAHIDEHQKRSPAFQRIVNRFGELRFPDSLDIVALSHTCMASGNGRNIACPTCFLSSGDRPLISFRSDRRRRHPERYRCRKGARFAFSIAMAGRPFTGEWNR